MSDTVSLNIALLPDEKVTQAAIQMSKDLSANLPTNFILNSQNLIPHLTIYQAEFPTKNIPEVEKQVQEMLQDKNPFELELFGFSATPQGNVWWNAADPEPMATFQKEAIERCNRLREGQLLPGIENLVKIGPEYANEVNNYGSVWLFDRYSPHISLTAVTPENISKTLEYLGEGKRDKFEAKEIFIGYLGKYGTVTEIIKRFTLN
jgi:hypothetical protein